MDHLDDLLSSSAPPAYAVTTELDRVTARVTARRRPSRGLAITGVVALMLGGATTAVAATGGFEDLVDYYLGQPNDHAWEMDIEVRGEVWSCVGGIVVLPATYKPDYVEADFLAAKQFIQDHDWSDLKPDRSLLMGRFETAETLAITADRHMIVVMQEAGLTVDSITTRGTATCEKK